ncbi:FmdB family transcriptional regulator [Acidovorax sp. SUPP3434]|uniref:FmdB family transcriptional regulator n=1 Tax=Acidovorax sp. SUPP3434 TaxID=2920880 RepID=UPI0024E04D18|nr:FmdB family transcriptional regulator [Acidovorax sp. SUPP3434]
MPIQSISHTQPNAWLPGGQSTTLQQDLIKKVLEMLLVSLLEKLGKKDDAPSSQPGGTPASSPASVPPSAPPSASPSPSPGPAPSPSAGPASPPSGAPAPTPTHGGTADTVPAPAPSTSPAIPGSGTAGNDFGTQSVAEGAGKVHPKFEPVLRGDESQKDAQIQTQADFGKAADATAREYGLDPNVFRAQLEVESNAFSKGFQGAMKLEGDLGRAGENNTSIGLGQISRKFLDGREWADGGPGNERVGGQKVSTEQYQGSVTTQLRMAASNLAQRVADHGGLQQGLAYYVSGNPDPGNANASAYIDRINTALKDPAVVGPGR